MKEVVAELQPGIRLVVTKNGEELIVDGKSYSLSDLICPFFVPDKESLPWDLKTLVEYYGSPKSLSTTFCVLIQMVPLLLTHKRLYFF